MKVKYVSLIAGSFLAVLLVAIFFFNSSSPNPEGSYTRNKIEIPKHAIQLSESERIILLEKLSHFYKTWPESELQLAAHHVYSLRDSSDYLEYIRSKGIGFIDSIGIRSQFLSKKQGWNYPYCNYFPVYTNKSAALNYDHKPLEELYKKGSYNALYYPKRSVSLISAISGFGPHKPSKFEFYDYFLDTNMSNQSIYCYRFFSKKNVPHKEHPLRGKGALWMQKSNQALTKMEFDSVYYESMTHGVVRNFGIQTKHDISCEISFERYEKGWFYKTVKMNIFYARERGVGQYPRRPNAKQNQLEEQELLYVDNIQGMEDYQSIQIPHVKVNYNAQVWRNDTVFMPYNFSQIRNDLETYKALKQQYRENHGVLLNEQGGSYSFEEKQAYRSLMKRYEQMKKDRF